VLFLLLAEGACRIGEYFVVRESSDDLPAKANGEFRVFFYGGSTVAGFPEARLGFVEQTRFWARTAFPGRNVTIHNLGLASKDSSAVLDRIAGTIHNDPDLVVVYCGHNEFLSRELKFSWTGLRQASGLLSHSALFRTLKRAVTRVVTKRPKATTDRIQPWDRASAEFALRLRNYEANLVDIVRLARRHEVPLLLCTPACNVLDWPPVYRNISGTKRDPVVYEREIDECLALLSKGELPAAELRITALLGDDPEDAAYHFLQGRLLAAKGDWERAAEHFGRARDLDPLPWRALTRFGEAIRRTASGPGVRLLDVERMIAANAPHGLPGFRLFLDNCHPTAQGNALIARDLIRLWVNDGLVPGGVLPEGLGRADLYLAGIGFGDDAEQNVDFLLKNALYVMSTPFHNYAAARRYLEEALRLEKENWRVWANLAAVSLLEDDREAGIRNLRRALELNAEIVRLGDDLRIPYLATALERAGIDLATLEERGAKPD